MDGIVGLCQGRLVRPLLAAHQAAPDLVLSPRSGAAANALTPPATCCADVTPAIHCYAKTRCYRSFDEMPCLMPLAWRRPREILRKPDKAMIHSSRRDRKAKAIAEVLAMIADAYPPLAPHRPRPVLETEEWLFESATEFIEASEQYYAERATQIKRKNH